MHPPPPAAATGAAAGVSRKAAARVALRPALRGAPSTGRGRTRGACAPPARARAGASSSAAAVPLAPSTRGPSTTTHPATPPPAQITVLTSDIRNAGTNCGTVWLQLEGPGGSSGWTRLEAGTDNVRGASAKGFGCCVHGRPTIAPPTAQTTPPLPTHTHSSSAAPATPFRCSRPTWGRSQRCGARADGGGGGGRCAAAGVAGNGKQVSSNYMLLGTCTHNATNAPPPPVCTRHRWACALRAPHVTGTWRRWRCCTQVRLRQGQGRAHSSLELWPLHCLRLGWPLHR